MHKKGREQKKNIQMSQKSSVKKDKANKNGNVKLLAVTNGREIERDMEIDAEDEHSRSEREREKKNIIFEMVHNYASTL